MYEFLDQPVLARTDQHAHARTRRTLPSNMLQILLSMLAQALLAPPLPRVYKSRAPFQ